MPLDDLATFELIRSARTLGVNQLESPGQMELVGKLQPEVFNDLTVKISLLRPGPMQNNMPLLYLQARHGTGRLPPNICTHASNPSCEGRRAWSSSTNR